MISLCKQLGRYFVHVHTYLKVRVLRVRHERGRLLLLLRSPSRFRGEDEALGHVVVDAAPAVVPAPDASPAPTRVSRLVLRRYAPSQVAAKGRGKWEKIEKEAYDLIPTCC